MDPQIHFHFTIEVGETTMGQVVLQLQSVLPGTEASLKFRSQEKINLFFTFRLADSETRYVNSEKK